ncbi:cingulin-like protein 1 isoform X1 [Sceloporus undulatus]|uniref:cingulin-like protein 1 isoform X1 n=1 Tax=Sceloporus undulatus TaxID=8520 RepID=UPI001C4B6671|nr:cingulin-like protein 1 isoform X1 [Sceloporus undulatus]
MRRMETYFGSFRSVQRQYDNGVHLKLVNNKGPEAQSTANAKPGSYGVSIRVQGIDGHPYIVLNNTERCQSENHLVTENSHEVASQPLHRPVPDSDCSPEKKTEENKPFLGNTSTSMFKSTLKQASMDEGENSNLHFKTGIPKFSSLLNFQRHPELLQPYDPQKNILNLEGFQSSLSSTSGSLEEEEKTDIKTWSSLLKVAPLDKTTLQFAELAKLKPKTVDLTMPAPEEDPSKQEGECPTVVDGLNGMPESLSSGGGSPYAVSPPTFQELKKCRPDLLPFRRQDSAGSVLNGSRRSSSSSTTPTSAASLYKFFLDDQEYAIYADNVNRHENRRYIPFLPGTGRDIDTGSIPAVDQLIEKFDRKVGSHRRSRLGMRNRIHPDDRKRSKSVDSALPCGLKVTSDGSEGFSKSLDPSPELIVRPAKVCLQKPLSPGQKATPTEEQDTLRSVGKLQAAAAVRDFPSSHFNSLQYCKEGKKTTDESLAFKSSTLPVLKKKAENKLVTSTLLLQNRITTQKISVKTFGPASNAQVTPDLLKGQQELAQQTNEETAKQILYNYLKEGGENDDATKRKVNLVFEKIQTLKSRAAGSTQASDTSAEVKALVEQKEQLEKEVSELRRKLDLEIRNQQNICDERDATKVELCEFQQKLEEIMEEKDTYQRQLEDSEKDLRQNLEELFQVKMEREQHQTEIRDLQDQLSEMHDELDCAKHVEEGERELLIEELMQLKQDLQAILMAKEQQEEVLRKRERELTALKGALKEEVSTHDQEMDQLKEQHDQELEALRKNLEEATEKVDALFNEKVMAEKMQRSAEYHVMEMIEENQQLKETLTELGNQKKQLQQELENLRGERDKMEERLNSYEKKQQHLEEALARAKEEMQELQLTRSSLEAQLADEQKNISQLSQEQQQLTDRLKDEANQKDQLKRMKSELENERWQLDKTIEKLHKEMAEIIEVSRASTLELQNQLDDYKEKNRHELVETQRQLKDKNLELEKAHLATLKLQDEVRFMGEELRDHQRAQDEAITKTQLLEQTVKALEYELEAKNHLKEDRARQAKIMEDKITQLELELEEERNNSDILSERISRCREQIEQMRSELLQERSVRQDLECDKISLDRQNKDLKSRILHLEGSYRSSKEGLLVQMETRIVELEERLENEERDRANLQLSNRRLERKVKELMMQVDDEHLSLTDQKDQLSLRLKAMKRQVEEAEEEIDRLESNKKKLQRELEEQVDLNDQLQGQLSAIKQELRRKKTSSKMLSDLDDEDDDFSTDGESLYEAPSGFKFLKDDEIKS